MGNPAAGTEEACSAKFFYRRRKNEDKEYIETRDGVISCNSIGMYGSTDHQRSRGSN